MSRRLEYNLSTRVCLESGGFGDDPSPCLLICRLFLMDGEQRFQANTHSFGVNQREELLDRDRLLTAPMLPHELHVTSSSSSRLPAPSHLTLASSLTGSLAGIN